MNYDIHTLYQDNTTAIDIYLATGILELQQPSELAPLVSIEFCSRSRFLLLYACLKHSNVHMSPKPMRVYYMYTKLVITNCPNISGSVPY